MTTIKKFTTIWFARIIKVKKHILLFIKHGRSHKEGEKNVGGVHWLCQCPKFGFGGKTSPYPRNNARKITRILQNTRPCNRLHTYGYGASAQQFDTCHDYGI